ncbi:MAG: DUF1028 domain-containing protein [Acidobacteria bacterium]|nr:DUF1028 domain-containing protein [Acidobacteriota bacterium]
MKIRVALLCLLSAVSNSAAIAQEFDWNQLSTFSIIARDPETGELGFAFQSKAFAGGNRISDAKGGLAVIAHQAVSDPMYGVIGLELLRAGMTPQDALDEMVRGDEGRNRRQVAILDIQGRTAAWTGPNCSDWKGHHCGTNYCAQGNTLAGPQVLDAMAETFENSKAPLAERLLGALDAAQAAGGDVRGVQSAALLIVKQLAGAAGFSDRAIDVRVDDHKQPLVELRRLLNMQRSLDMLTEANRFIRSGDLKRALQAAIAARDRSPENDNAWVALAGVYARMDSKAEALTALKRASELNPANAHRLPLDPLFVPLYRSAEPQP